MSESVKESGRMPGGLAAWLLEAMERGRAGWGVRRGERAMQLVETLALGGKRQLMLVTVGGRKFLVGAGAEGVTSIVAADEEAAR